MRDAITLTKPALRMAPAMLRLNLSSKTLREESRIKTLLWPDLGTLPSIESAIDNGKITAFVIGGIAFLLVLFRAFPIASSVDVALYAGLGYGIKRKSRTCAALALILYLSGQAISYLTGRGGWNIVLVVIIIFIFVNAARGAFAYHRFIKKDKVQTPPEIAA
jgi:hypothetical protein